MKSLEFKTFLLAGLALSAWIFSASVSATHLIPAAGCVENGYDSEVVTPYGGSTLSCPSGYQPCTIENITDGQSCTFIGGTIGITVNNKIITWTGNNLAEGYKIDVVITDTATGANGCFQAFGTDQTGGEAGFYKDNLAPLTTRAIAFCADGNNDVTAVVQPLAVVEECVIGSGLSKEIHGVTFSCPLVPAGETRTIIVSKDTTNCTNVGTAGDPVYECFPVPGFGFLGDQNTLDFNNVCQCVGGVASSGQSVLKEECDPDPQNTASGCEVGAEAENPIVVTIQNPKCFTVGGFTRCF